MPSQPNACTSCVHRTTKQGIPGYSKTESRALKEPAGHGRASHGPRRLSSAQQEDTEPTPSPCARADLGPGTQHQA